jgi:hypothetical protein
LKVIGFSLIVFSWVHGSQFSLGSGLQIVNNLVAICHFLHFLQVFQTRMDEAKLGAGLASFVVLADKTEKMTRSRRNGDLAVLHNNFLYLRLRHDAGTLLTV